LGNIVATQYTILIIIIIIKKPILSLLHTSSTLNLKNSSNPLLSSSLQSIAVESEPKQHGGLPSTAGTTAIALMATTKSSRRTIKSTNENTT